MTDHKDICYTCRGPMIRGVYREEYYFDPKKSGYEDDNFQKFMDEIRKEWRLAGLVSFPVAEMFCEKNHCTTLLGEIRSPDRPYTHEMYS